MITVSSVMSRHIAGVSLNTKIGVVSELMQKSHISLVPVLDGAILVGIITKDSVGENPNGEIPAGMIMKTPVFVEEHSDIEHAVSILVKTGYSRLPVVDNKSNMRITGIVTSTGLADVIRRREGKM